VPARVYKPVTFPKLDEENSNISSSGMDFPWKKMNGNMSMTLNMPKNSLTTSSLDRSHTAALERGGGNVRESTP
jgi:hypothetical protein